jgi:four helix bundle protein
VNRARTEAAETIHHLYMARRKGYLGTSMYERLRGRYEECIRMLNGLERSLERHLPRDEWHWPG